jgi:hypothetical protein
MADLKLDMACWNYDRTRALIDGSVRPQGIDLVYHNLFVGDIFPRMVRDKAFDVSELGLTFYLGTLDRDDPPFIALPVFPLRLFRHAAIFVNAESGIEKPQDLIGKRVGELLFYGHDAGVWIKGILAEEYGVTPDSVRYWTGGVDHFAPNWDWLPFNTYPPKHVQVERLQPGQTLAAMLEAGELDAVYSAIMPPALRNGGPRIRRLFPDYETVERDYFKRTGIFPIMHTVVIRRDVYEKNPWIARALYDAFKEAKAQIDRQYEVNASWMHNYHMTPWLSQLRDENEALMGPDPWAYGVEANRKTLDAFLRYHHEQGMTRRRFSVEEIFVPELLTD